MVFTQPKIDPADVDDPNFKGFPQLTTTYSMESQMTWAELMHYVIARVNTSEKKTLNQAQLRSFKEWFVIRKPLGMKIDYRLVMRAFYVWNEYQKRLDHFLCFTGRPGYGKTTAACNFLAWVNPSFSMVNICTTAKDYLSLVRAKIAEYKQSKKIVPISILLDEGTEAMSSDAQEATNKALMKTFFIQRKLQICVGICQPSFFALSPTIREQHTRTLIHITDKGRYKCFTKRAIDVLVDQHSKHKKNILAAQVPDGTYFNGSFRLEFPDTLNYEAYEHDAILSIDNTLGDLQQKLKAKDMVLLADASNTLNIDLKTLLKASKAGNLKVERIGSRWYIGVAEFDRLLTLGKSVKAVLEAESKLKEPEIV
jgi:DNA polymerase III delta prime subunit